MKKTKLILAMAPMLLGASTIVNAQLSSQTNTGITNVQSVGHTPSAPSIVLYDQSGLAPRGNGVPDQNFEAAYDAYDSEAADDFVVPAGPSNWAINTVNIIGTTGTAGSSTVDITFYQDNSGAPGAAVAGCSYTGLVPVDTAGSFTTTLSTACVLTPGTYWMGHITNQDFPTSGQHFFSNTDTVTGAESHYSNPLDGFGSGCTSFAPAGTTCGVGGGAPAFDLLFSLEGDVVAGALPPPTPVPSLSWLGLAMMVLSLGFFGRRFVK